MYQEDIVETIELTMPVNSAYVSALRLTASSISNRLKFEIDDIEDIKTAVSESCTYLLSNADKKIHKNFNIKFSVYDEKIVICLSMPHMALPDNGNDHMALTMVQALMDQMTVQKGKPDSLDIVITKYRSQLGKEPGGQH